MVARTLALVIALTLAVAAHPAVAGTTRYDPQRSGHPLRILAYVLHPIGVMMDELIFHPAWWLGTHEPLRTLFGVDVVFDDSADVAREVAEQKAQAHSQDVEPPPPQEPDRDTNPAPVPAPEAPEPPVPENP